MRKAIRTKDISTTSRRKSTPRPARSPCARIFDNKDHALLPGLFVRVRGPIGHQDKALLTRNDAIGTNQEGSYVLVVGADNVVSRKIVKTGQKQGQLVIIESGLDPGDWVVIEGIQQAFPGAKVEPQRSELNVAEPKPIHPTTPSRAAPTQRRNETSRGTGMISRFFIDRPVLANVLALVFVLVGLVALLQLPSAEYPNVVPPTIQVTTLYPGATAKTLVDTVALPIEQQVNGVEGMLYMQSTSASDGTYNLTVTFDIGTDPNIDADPGSEPSIRRPRVAAPGRADRGCDDGRRNRARFSNSSPWCRLTAASTTCFCRTTPSSALQNELARLKGVGNVTIFGAGEYAMRIWMNPDLLQTRGLTPQDVISAIQQQSQQVTAGQAGAPPAPKGQDFQYSLDIKGRFDEVAEFEDIVVKAG